MRTPLAVRLRRLLWTPLRLEANRQVGRWLRAVRRLRRTQARLLERLLATFAETDFGRDFRLAGARTIDDLRARLPVAGYERVEPYVRRLTHGRMEALLPAGTRLLMFALTSGTTGRAKYIPVTDTFLRRWREGWHIWGARALQDHYDAFGARILQISSRVDEEMTPAGIPAGSISGLSARAQRRLVHRMYVAPPAAAYAADTESKYYLLCRLGLGCRRVMPITANPSTLLGLARAMDRRKEALLRDLADGTLSPEVAIDGEARRTIERRLRPQPERARDLARLAERLDRLYPQDAWEIPLIGTWKGGTLGLYLRELPRYWGEAPVRDIGLIASEGRFSIPLQTEGSAGVLEATATFYEFIPEEALGREDPPTLLAHEVEVGRRYGLVVTTLSGLFRYDMGDVVEVVDRMDEAPVIAFLNKGEHVSNLTGEKLTEHQVVEAVSRAADRLGLRLEGYCLCPTWAEVPYYSLLVEASDVPAERAAEAAAAVDAELARRNVEYEAKRASGRLAPVRVKLVPPGTWAAFDRDLVEQRRGRVEQYKHKFLEPQVGFEGRFRILGEFGPGGGDAEPHRQAESQRRCD